MSVELIDPAVEPDGERTHRCTNCGWHGIPTYIGGEPQTRCPVCPLPKGAGRNRPCACGSGVKAKKCCAR